MGELGRIHQLIIPVFGYSMTFNLEVILMTWIAFLVIFVLGFLMARRRGMVPESMQVIGELLVSNLYKLTEDALDKEMAKKYGPLICALFLFLLVSNWLGIVPHLDEPTKDLNTPLSLGLMGFVIAHVAGIRKKGFKTYASEYFQPIFFMAPLNIIGEFAKIVSISFRLFGNIMGGSIIILVVSYLTYSIVLPPLTLITWRVI